MSVNQDINVAFNDIGWKEVLSAKHFSSVLDQIEAKSEDWVKFPCTIEDMDKAKTGLQNSAFQLPLEL